MADLLLTHGYFLCEDEKEVEIMKPYAPLGLLYLSAFLRRSGFEVEVFDSTLSPPAHLTAQSCGQCRPKAKYVSDLAIPAPS